MELIDVIWGITRMSHRTQTSSDVNQEDELFRITESPETLFE